MLALLAMLAMLAMLTAATMPPLEVVPFAASSAGLVLSLYGLALTTRDGALALLAIAASLGGGWLAARAIFL